MRTSAITEADLQKGVVTMLRYRRMKCTWRHTPNQGDFPVQHRKKLSDMGLLPGVADLTFQAGPNAPVPVGHIELKRKNGRQNDNQKAFQEACKAQGVPYEVVKTDDQNEMIARVIGILSAWGMS